MKSEENKIVMYDNKIKIKQAKNNFLGSLGLLLILFGLISFGYKTGTHGISDTFTFGCLIVGILLILVNFLKKS